MLSVRYAISSTHLVPIMVCVGHYVVPVVPILHDIWSSDLEAMGGFLGSMVKIGEPIDVVASVVANEKEEVLVHNGATILVVAYPLTIS